MVLLPTFLLQRLVCLAFRHSEGTHQRIRYHHHLCPALGQSTVLIRFEGWNPTETYQHHNSRVHNFQELVHIILRVWKTQVVQHELHLPGPGSSGSPWDEKCRKSTSWCKLKALGSQGMRYLMFIYSRFITHNVLKHIKTMEVWGGNLLKKTICDINHKTRMNLYHIGAPYGSDSAGQDRPGTPCTSCPTSFPLRSVSNLSSSSWHLRLRCAKWHEMVRADMVKGCILVKAKFA